jgi:hypothetical protein
MRKLIVGLLTGLLAIWSNAQIMQQAIVNTHEPSGGSGSLSCTPTINNSGATWNLTTGSTDWIMWNNGVVERKSSGGSQISTYTVVGAGGATIYNNFDYTLTWTDGTPDTTGSSKYGVYTTGATGDGFYFTCPANDTSHTCLYYGVLNAGTSGNQATITAHLSDSSATDYSAPLTSTRSGFNDFYLSCTYNAASSGQTLKITETLLTSGSDDMAIEGATYQ